MVQLLFGLALLMVSGLGAARAIVAYSRTDRDEVFLATEFVLTFLVLGYLLTEYAGEQLEVARVMAVVIGIGIGIVFACWCACRREKRTAHKQGV